LLAKEGGLQPKIDQIGSERKKKSSGRRLRGGWKCIVNGRKLGETLASCSTALVKGGGGPGIENKYGRQPREKPVQPAKIEREKRG